MNIVDQAIVLTQCAIIYDGTIWTISCRIRVLPESLRTLAAMDRVASVQVNASVTKPFQCLKFIN